MQPDSSTDVEPSSTPTELYPALLDPPIDSRGDSRPQVLDPSHFAERQRQSLEGSIVKSRELKDKETQTEGTVFTVTEQQHLLKLTRKGLEGRINALEVELASIKTNRDTLASESANLRSQLAERAPTSTSSRVRSLSSPINRDSSLSSSPALGIFRSFPFTALTTLKAFVPSLKRIIAPLPHRDRRAIAADSPTPSAPLEHPRHSPAPRKPPSRIPIFSACDTPPSSTTPAPTELLARLSVVRFFDLDESSTCKHVQDFLVRSRPEPFPRPLAISAKSSTGDVLVAFRSNTQAHLAIKLFGTRVLAPGSRPFKVKVEPRGSHEFSWEEFSEEVKAAWMDSGRIPNSLWINPVKGGEKRRMAEGSSVRLKDRIQPQASSHVHSRGGGGGGGTPKKRRKQGNREPSPRHQPREQPPVEPRQADTTIGIPPRPTNYPSIDFAAPPINFAARTMPPSLVDSETFTA